MNWANLEIVLAIAKAKSLTSAAQLLSMDQTTIGRRLSAIEHELKAPLFVRLKSGIVPTEEGLIVIEHAYRLEAELSAMNERLDFARGEVSGVMRILANSWMLEKLAGQPAAQLLMRHPQLELRLSARLPPVPVYSESTLSLWFDADPREGEVARPLCRIPYSAYRGVSVGADVKEWVEFRDDNATGRNFTRQIRKRRSKDAYVRLSATDAGTLTSAVQAGVGIGILPVCLAEGQADLVEHNPDRHRTERILHVHAKPEVHDNTKARVVIDWLKGTVGEAFGALPIG
ncbi:MAG: LysR family transcriptional regulator [Cognatishimia sp.]|uniref:LysR family transcriptional regulator n=1 Tax=Cognatishimia sp. TaxID=2211648 RepID=UPI003B8D85F7